MTCGWSTSRMPPSFSVAPSLSVMVPMLKPPELILRFCSVALPLGKAGEERATLAALMSRGVEAPLL